MFISLGMTRTGRMYLLYGENYAKYIEIEMVTFINQDLFGFNKRCTCAQLDGKQTELFVEIVYLLKLNIGPFIIMPSNTC